jgi:purine-binding chemotaxis protein CheW
MAILKDASASAGNPIAVQQKLLRRANQLRGGAAPTADVPTSALLTFNSGHERYAIHLRDVVEIQKLEQYSPVPGTPAFIVGVIHWRGSVLTLLDLGRLLGLPEAGIADYHVSIVVEVARTRIALVAREVEEIASVRLDQIRSLPELPNAIPIEWVTGVVDGNRMLLSLAAILRDDRLISWRNRRASDKNLI